MASSARVSRSCRKPESRRALLHRAFIAAPLIGTIMFLVATVFVVGMVNTESQEVNRATVDAYHNKLVSMLELYRLDLYSLFVDGLRQNVEDFLAGIPWINLNSVSDNSPQARYANCFEMKKAIRSQIISSGASFETKCTLDGRPEVDCAGKAGKCFTTIGSTIGGEKTPNADNSCPGGSYKCQCSGGGTFLNGLSDLLDKLRNKDRPPSYELVFEGVVFKPVKFDNWDFTCSSGSVAGSPTGRQLCEKLVPRAMFDCYNFATNADAPYRCCTVENTPEQAFGNSLNKNCAAKGGEVKTEGCDNGAFLLSVNLADPEVYKYMPRIDATDGAGNQIRSGALGEKPLELRVRYPIFKYRHASFEFFSKLQYADGEGGAHASEVTPNIFAGKIKAACNRLGVLKENTDDAIRADLSANITLSSGEAIVECTHGSGAAMVFSCYKRSGAGFDKNQCGSDLAKFVSKEWYDDEHVDDHKITTRTPQVDFIDNDERFRVNLGGPNKYSWNAVLCFPTATTVCS